MARNRSLRVKAMFLLITFLLNTVVGLACAIGTGIDFNEHHADHTHAEHHHHDEKENCCKDEVAKLTASSKLTPRIFDFSQLSLPFTALLGNVFPAIPVVNLPANVPNAYFTRHCRSPIRDVRIAIQSFQI